MTIVEAILDQAGGSGTLTLLGSRPGTETVIGWARLHQRARRMASVLVAAGIGRGSRVGLLGDTSAGLIAAIQAVWFAGAAVTVLPRPLRRAAPLSLTPIVINAGLHLVIGDADLSHRIATAPFLALPELERRARAAEPVPVRCPDPTDLAVLQYTSGATWTPRGVPVRHAHLAANISALEETFGHDPSRPHRLMSWLPLYHDLGLIGFLCYPMSLGCPLVLQSPAAFALRPASWLEALSRHRSTITAAPDVAYRLVTPLLEAGLDVDLSAVRFMLSGGEPIHPGAMARFLTAAARHGLDPKAIVPGYGLAEATLAVTCSAPGAGLTTDSVDPGALEQAGRAVPPRSGGRVRTLARLGRPVPGTRVRIIDRRTGAPAAERQVGEVEVQGASVVGHYWGEPPPTAGAWLRTGDLGYLTGGELVLCGREKEVLFAAGRNLYPHDIEVAAGQVPGVRPGGVIAFGIPDEQGDRLVVVVEARAGDRSDLCRAVAVAVADEIGMRPTRVIALPPGRLPRTTSGKLRRAEARRRYECGELTTSPGPRTLPSGDVHLTDSSWYSTVAGMRWNIAMSGYHPDHGHHHPEAPSSTDGLSRRSILAGAGGLLMLAAAPGTAHAAGTRTALAPTETPQSGAARASQISQGTLLVHADMHNHTVLSDGDGDPQLAFASMREAGLDVAAITDHSTLFAIEGLSQGDWNVIGGLADAADDPGQYTAIRGFEWSHPLLGHVNVWFTGDFVDLAGASGMGSLYNWLAARGNGVASFNHPGREIGRFNNFGFSSGAREQVVSMEIFNRTDDYLFEGWSSGMSSPLVACLNRGWRVGLSGVTDEHGTNWGFPEGKGRAGLWVTENTRQGVFEAMRARRFFATRVSGLRLDATANGVRMGGTLPVTRGDIQFTVDLDRGPIWAGKPLHIQVLRPGSRAPSVADVIETVSGNLVSFTVPLDAADGSWVVLRVSDPSAPNGSPGPAGHPCNDFGVAYTSPWWLAA